VVRVIRAQVVSCVVLVLECLSSHITVALLEVAGAEGKLKMAFLVGGKNVEGQETARRLNFNCSLSGTNKLVLVILFPFSTRIC